MALKKTVHYVPSIFLSIIDTIDVDLLNFK